MIQPMSPDAPRVASDDKLPFAVFVPRVVAAAFLFQNGTFLIVGLMFILSLSSVSAKAILAPLFVILCFYISFRQLRQRLVLGRSTIDYQQKSSKQAIPYKDIQKIGYHYTFTSGRYGGSELWLELFLTSQTKPIKIPIGTFLKKNIFTLIYIIIQKNPHILVGDKLAEGLRLGTFPEKRAFMTFPRLEIQDAQFTPAQPGQYILPEQADSEPYGLYLVLVLLNAIAVIVAFYATLHLDVVLFFGAIVAALVVGTVGAIIKRALS